MRQQNLPFERIEKSRLALIDRLTPESCPGLSERRCAAVRELLKTIWLRCSDGAGVSHAYVSTIASCMRCSRRTAVNRIRDAENLGVLHVWSKFRKGRGQVNSEYSIDWEHIQDLTNRAARTAGAHAKAAGAHAKAAAPHGGRTVGKGVIQPINPTIQKPPPLAPQANAESDTADGGDTAAWNEAEESLKRTGLAMAGDTAGLAREAGRSAAEVIQIAATYEANRSRFRSPGAIVHVLRTGQWPIAGVRDAREVERSNKAREAKRRKDEVERAARQRLLRQEQREAADRESKHGPQLDAMSSQERDELAASVFGSDRFAWERWNRQPESMRGALLEQLAGGGRQC
jgi:hypothetical protein